MHEIINREFIRINNEDIKSISEFCTDIIDDETFKYYFWDKTAWYINDAGKFVKATPLEQQIQKFLNMMYIPSKDTSAMNLVYEIEHGKDKNDVDYKLKTSGLYDTFDKNNPKKREVGDLVNAAGQTFECIQAHDESIYSDINPNNPQTWHTFYKPLHGKSKETARPFVKPQFGTTDMYLKGEYMVYTDGKIYKCLRDTVYSPEEYAADWEVQQ